MENEKRLIDANEVERKLRLAISSWHCDCNSNAPVIARAMEDALQRVIYAPTVYAVEVVRCKDCRDCEMCYPEKRLDKEATQAWLCKRYKEYRKPDDFCSYGERKCKE